MLVLGDFSFDLDQSQLFNKSGNPVRLRNKSLRTLCVLAEAADRVVSKDEIIAQVWGQPSVSDESLSQCISDIRRAISDTDKKILQTVPGQGFLLAGRRDERQSKGQLPTVSVEPFALLEDDPDAHRIASRVMQEILQALSRRSGIRVLSGVAPESSDYVIRGSLSSVGNTRTVFMEIMEVAGRGSFYTETFTFTDTSPEAFAQRVARKVTNVQRVSAIANFGERFLDIPDRQLDLQQLLQKAAYHYGRITLEDTEAARQVLSEAVDRYPQSPMALAMLAATHVHMYPLVSIDRSPDRVEAAMELAERAVFAGPNVDFALRTRGNLKFWLLQDHEGAIGDCKRALAVTPNYQLAHLTMVECDLFAGRIAQARHRLETQIEMDIVLPQYHFFQTLYALIALLEDNMSAARHHAFEAFEVAPWSDWGILVMAVVHGREIGTISHGMEARIARCSLNARHFCDLPIRDDALVGRLVSLAERAGL